MMNKDRAAKKKTGFHRRLSLCTGDGGVYDELWSNAILLQQYRNIKNIAAQNGVSIFNATLSGALDEFERVGLDSLWGS
jgi:hypothetical protein